MTYPHFIALDASSYEETAHPIAIAWSLADGSIKTVLIQPEDDWEDWDYALEDMHGITQDTLYQRGETPWSIIRELEEDLEQPFLHTAHTELTLTLLERIYEACGRELSLELGDHRVELPNVPDLYDWYMDTAFDQQPCDERVRLMLLLSVESE